MVRNAREHVQVLMEQVMLILNIQREKEEALKKILKLEKDIDAKQKLEMEIAELKGKVEEVMKHLGGNDGGDSSNREDNINELVSKMN